jgi:hypothetical protein
VKAAAMEVLGHNGGRPMARGHGGREMRGRP